QIDEVTGTSPEVREVFDGEAQSAGTGRANHEPGRTSREMLVGNFGREFFVIRLVIVPADSLFGHAGRAASLENIVRTSFKWRGYPDLGLQVAQPFVLKMRETGD